MKHYDPNKSYVMNQTKTIEGVEYESGSRPPNLPRHTLDLFLQHHIIREDNTKVKPVIAPVVIETPIVVTETPEVTVAPAPEPQAIIQKDADGYYMVFVGGMPRFRTDTKAKKPAIEWCEANNLTYVIS